MSDQTVTAEQAMRRFKKKTAPLYVKPDYVVPCGTYGMPGVTLRPMPPAVRSPLKVVESRPN